MTPLTSEEIKIFSTFLQRAVRFNQTKLLMEQMQITLGAHCKAHSGYEISTLFQHCEGIMTDASKRRLEDGEDLDEWDKIAEIESSAGKTPEQISRLLFEECLDVPIPPGLSSIEDWSKTMCVMDKVKHLKRELVRTAGHRSEAERT